MVLLLNAEASYELSTQGVFKFFQVSMKYDLLLYLPSDKFLSELFSQVVASSYDFLFEFWLDFPHDEHLSALLTVLNPL